MKTYWMLVLFLLLGMTEFSFAQCYQVEQRPYYPAAYTGTGTLSSILSFPDFNKYSPIIDIGFPFCFFGDTITQLIVGENGIVSFDLDSAGLSCPSVIATSAPSPDLPLFSIMAPFQDIQVNYSLFSLYNGARISRSGVAPYRRLTISYTDVDLVTSGCTGVSTNTQSQIVLYESLNYIDINIKDKNVCPAWNNGAAIEGIHNQDGTEAYVVVGRNYPDQWTAQFDSYRFTPLCDCASDSISGELVSGKVYEDTDDNCFYSPTEPLIPNIQIEIQPNNGIVWANQNGEFAFITDPGSYNLQHGSNNPWYIANSCEPSGIDIDVVADSSIADLIFGDTITFFSDLSVTVVSSNLDVCFPTGQLIKVCNLGNDTVLNSELILQYPDFLLNVYSDLEITSDSTLGLLIDTIMPWECKSYYIHDSIGCQTTLIGENGCFTAWIFNPSDNDHTNNQSTFCDVIGGSYDPNDKRVLSTADQLTWLYEEEIADTAQLTYMIRFQNTGTGTAYNVRIKDMLPSYLDPHSIRSVTASHDHYMQFSNGELWFNFLGIQLPDSAADQQGSKGFVIFKIDQVSGNEVGTVIENQAAIYFDHNPAVMTNATVNTIPFPVGVARQEEDKIRIYPNPSTGEVFFSNSSPRNTINSVEVIDTQGRLLLRQSGSGISKVDLSALSTGIYLLRIQTAKGSQVSRVIRN